MVSTCAYVAMDARVEDLEHRNVEGNLLTYVDTIGGTEVQPFLRKEPKGKIEAA